MDVPLGEREGPAAAPDPGVGTTNGDPPNPRARTTNDHPPNPGARTTNGDPFPPSAGPQEQPPTLAWPSDAELLAVAGPERLARELVQAQKMEAIGQLASGVAHELNNPLAAIVAFSQLIGRDPRLPADLRQDADLLVHEADRTRRIVQGLLDFARHRPPERHPTSLRALVGSIIDLEAYLISSTGVEVEVDIPDDVPPVAVDRAQMQQVLLNLTLNAIQAIRSQGRGGRVSIRAEVDERPPVVRLLVTDDGPGVEPAQRDRLFVPFFTTREPGQGTGLGLPVSLRIVAAHGGRLRYEPGDGEGATFVVELPPSGADDSRDNPREERADGNENAPAGHGLRHAPDSTVPRVLVLDDEPSIRRFLAKALEMAGCAAVPARDGSEAIALLRGQPIDAVLCDHRMAGMTGTQFYEDALAIQPDLARRFVFMSGDVLNPELRSFADRRGLALLTKPFDLETVGRTVRAVLDGADADPRPIASAAG